MKEKLLRLSVYGQIAAASLFAPLAALAQTTTGGTTTGGTGAPRYSLPDAPESVGEFESLIDTIVGWLFSFLIFLAVIFVMVAAYKYLTAGGDPEKVKEASNMLIYAAVAIAVALLARGLPFLVGGLVGREIGG